MFEWITNTEEEFIIGVKGSLGYSDCSKYLAYSIEIQATGFEIQVSVVESLAWGTGKVGGGVHSKQIFRLVRARQNYIL